MKFLVLAIGIVFGQVDECGKLVGKELASYDEAMACYRSFPLTEQVRHGTLETLRKVVDHFYVFTDLALKSPEPQHMPSEVDLLGELRLMEHREYNNELDFQTDVARLFRSLNDGHTTYTPMCFSRFRFKQPFPVYAAEDDSGQVQIRVLDKSRMQSGFAKGWEHMNLTKHFGSVVAKIDGLPALEYLKGFADNRIGLSRDGGSRINFAMARILLKDGKWGFTHGEFSNTLVPPEKSCLTFEFADKSLVRVPYLVEIPPNMKPAGTYCKDFCKAKPQELERDSGSPEVEMRELKVPAVLEVKMHAPLPPRRQRDMNPLQSPLVNGKHIKSYLVGLNTGVLVIPDFENPSLAWYEEVRESFRQFFRQGVTKLILDLSNNGGGIICRGYNILRFLFPNSPYFDTDMRFSPIIGNLTQVPTAHFFPPLNFDQPDGSPYNDKDAFIHTHPRHNRTRNHTPFFRDRCQSNFLNSLITDQPPFKAEDIAIVSNSICYSTCALLTNALKELHDVKTYAKGPITHSQTASLAGGAVFSFESLLKSLDNSFLSDEADAPQPLPTRAQLRFTIREAYSHNKVPRRPLEFTHFLTTSHSNYTSLDVFDPHAVWESIAADLKDEGFLPEDDEVSSDYQGT